MRFFILFLLLFTSLSVFSQSTNVTSAYFDFDKSVLKKEAIGELAKMIETYKQSGSSAGIVIKGYCDAKGTDEYNVRLSKDRAAAVKKYLEVNGIASKDIVLWEGYGETGALNSNSTPEERQLNRRVEISYPMSAVSIVETPKETTLEKRVETATKGESISLHNINFYGGRHTFLTQSQPALIELLDVMKSHPSLSIEIQGHICCRIGLDEDGEDFDSGDKLLSQNRARAVYEYLARNGIEATRMTYKGFAGKVPLINPEVTEEDRTLNRRVEIKVLNK